MKSELYRKKIIIISFFYRAFVFITTFVFLFSNIIASLPQALQNTKLAEYLKINEARAATRFYIQNAAPDYDPPTIRGAWDDPTGYDTSKKLSSVKSGSIVYNRTNKGTTADAWDILSIKAISDPLAAQTISGTVNWVTGAKEQHAICNAHYHMHIFVTVGDTDVVRGTLLTDSTDPAGTNEITTTYQGHGTNGGTAKNLTSLDIQAGDRIVVELGTVQYQTAASHFVDLSYGGTGSTDLTVGGNSDSNPSWIEFSGGIALQTTTLTQKDFRWYNNADSVQPSSTAIAAENATGTISSISSPVRLRMNITASSTALATSTQQFKLQWSTSTSGGWSDVITDGIWQFYDNSTPADGAAITSNLLTASNQAESYQESNPTVLNLKAIPAGQEGEWDFALDPANATSTTYYFRMIKSDSTVLDTYTRYPALTISSAPASPGQPGTPSYTNVSTSTLTVSWTAATNADYYKLERALTCGTFSEIATTTALTRNDSGLATSTSYCYRVRGTNAQGDGPYSASSSVTTSGGGFSSSISIKTFDAANDPTLFYLSDGAIWMQEGAQSAVRLTSSAVTVTNLIFSNYSYPNTPGIIRIQFTLTRVNPQNKNEYNYSEIFYGTANKRQP